MGNIAAKCQGMDEAPGKFSEAIRTSPFLCFRRIDFILAFRWDAKEYGGCYQGNKLGHHYQLVSPDH